MHIINGRCGYALNLGAPYSPMWWHWLIPTTCWSWYTTLETTFFTNFGKKTSTKGQFLALIAIWGKFSREMLQSSPSNQFYSWKMVYNVLILLIFIIKLYTLQCEVMKQFQLESAVLFGRDNRLPWKLCRAEFRKPTKWAHFWKGCFSPQVWSHCLMSFWVFQFAGLDWNALSRTLPAICKYSVCN